VTERYFIVEQVAERWHCSTRSVQERIARGEIPHVKLPAMRRILLPIDQIEAYEAGDVEIERVELRGAGRICRPQSSSNGDVSQTGSAS
jgi:hypothetical protein